MQPQHEGATAAGPWLDGDRPTLIVHQPPSDEQAEARPVAADRLHVPLEHSLLKRLGDSREAQADREAAITPDTTTLNARLRVTTSSPRS